MRESPADLLRKSTELRFKGLEGSIAALESEMHDRRIERAFFIELLRVIGPKLGEKVLSGCASRALMSAAARGLPEYRLEALRNNLLAFVATSSGGNTTT